MGALVGLALLFRIGHLVFLYRSGFAWPDVDHYLANGASLVASGRFRWTFDAVDYAWGGRIYALPPLFSLYLAPFAAWSPYPFNAIVGLAILNAAIVPLVVRLGARLHSLRAGLVAGLLYACWGADIAAFAAVRQEALYVPLVIAATLALVRAWDGDGGRLAFPLAGAAFGLAALCRSMPIYFVAAMAVAIALRGRGTGRRDALAFAAGFAALTLPYSIALSLHLGRPTLIENHGGILVAHRYVTGHRDAPGFGEVVLAILGQAATAPVQFASGVLEQARSLLHVSGGRYLQEGVSAESAAAAWLWKAAAHTLIDLPWVLALVLAPLGAVLARSSPAAAILAAWALLNVALTALTGFGGSRLRGPFEVHLALLAAVVLAGPWTMPRRWLLVLGLAGSAGLAAVVAPQIERTARARADYGTPWVPAGTETLARVNGTSGANVLVSSGGLAITVTNPGPQPIVVDVAVDGTPVMQAAAIEPGHHRRAAIPYGPPALAFVEVDARDARTNPATADVRVTR